MFGLSRARRRAEAFWVTADMPAMSYWRITPDGISQEGVPPDDGSEPVLGFSESDFRLLLRQRITAASVRKVLLHQFNEPRCRQVLRKGPRLAYATPTHRLGQFSHPLYPGAQLLDLLLEKETLPTGRDQIVGFHFEDVPRRYSIVILYAMKASGDLSPPQITIDPPDLSMLVREFAKSNNVEHDGNVFLHQAADLLAILDQGIPYPQVDSFYGIPYPYLAWGATGVAIAGCAGLLSLSFLAQQQIKDLSAQAQAAAARTRAATAANADMVRADITAYSHMMSLDARRVFDYAEAARSDISMVKSLHADRSLGELRVQVAVEPAGKRLTSSLSTSLVNDPEQVRAAINRLPGDTATRSQLGLNGEANAFEIVYQFPTMDFDPDSLGR